MSTPPNVLLVRAVSHMDRALLELNHNRDIQAGAEWIEKGLALVKEVLSNG